MARTVYIAEKPDVGNKIAAALGVRRKISGGVECEGNAVVTWCLGHLLEPQMPEDMDEDLREWRWDTLPIVPKPFRFRPRDEKAGKQLRIIGDLIARADSVVLATDADREGEMIGWEVLTWHGYDGEVKRLWLDDQTPTAIRAALSGLLPGSRTKPLYHAAMARACADFLVGINMTRAATLRLRGGGRGSISIGRVQTPTLALVVHREQSVRNFVPETYHELVAEVSTGSGARLRMRHAPPPEERIKDRNAAERLRAAAEGDDSTISRSVEERREPPPAPPDLSHLQQEANAHLGLSADRTLKIAQALYEKHDLVSYPRTESRALPEAHKDNFAAIRANLAGIEQLAEAAEAAADPEFRGDVYDDAKVESHYAIVPTSKAPDPAALGAEEFAVYLMIARHYLAAHLPDRRYLATRYESTFGGVTFTAGGTRTTDAGWRSAFGAAPSADAGYAEADEADGEEDVTEDAEVDIPDVPDGDRGRADAVSVEDRKTRPPAHFTEATLIKKMCNIANDIEDPETRRILRESSGIGTNATRSGIIETLKKRGFVVVRKKKIRPTEAGESLVRTLDEKIPLYADPVQTARWEDGLGDVARSRASARDFIRGVVSQVGRDVEHLRAAEDVRTVPERKGTGGDGKRGGGKHADRKHGGGRRGGTAAGTSRDPGDSGGDGDDPGLRRWKEAMRDGPVLDVPYDQRHRAKELGAFWDKRRKAWRIHPRDDPSPFREAGWL